MPKSGNERPRHRRGFLWESLENSVTPLATLSETLRPLPSPPTNVLQDPVSRSTLDRYPHLFRIVTPIDVDRFEFLLANHPNRPLVESVVQGLRKGFWPFAETEGQDFPDTWDEGSMALDVEAEAFVEEYARAEQAVDRYSEPFGSELLPGMYSMPIHAVPKPHSDKLRLINNHSAGLWSLNAMIDRGKVGMRPDNVQDLGKNLVHFRNLHGDAPVWLFKSDVKNAYRLLPMHPLWQLKQVVTVNDQRQVDRCLCFGSRGSPDIWSAFQALVVWIAINVKGVDDLLAYMDDTFSYDPAEDLLLYKPYQSFMPPKQVQLLRLWDELHIPHAPEKQLYGRSLTIIGFSVDATTMKITLPRERLDELVHAIHSFIDDAVLRRRRLREWQQLAGWINWALNVQPLLRPGLQSIYQKIGPLKLPHAPVWFNARIIRDLLWIADHLDRSDGVFILHSTIWRCNDADLILYCDASSHGLGFWCPATNEGFVADIPEAPKDVEDNIFWFEALTVLSALEWASRRKQRPTHLLIYTDNLNTVQMFDRLRGAPVYDELLLLACNILIDSGIDLRVWHVAGVINVVADALSRQLFQVVLTYVPSLLVKPFQPPHFALGARLK